MAERSGEDAMEMIRGEARGARGGLERDRAMSLSVEELAPTRGPAQHLGSGGSARGRDAGHLPECLLVTEEEAAGQDQVVFFDFVLRRLGDA